MSQIQYTSDYEAYIDRLTNEGGIILFLQKENGTLSTVKIRPQRTIKDLVNLVQHLTGIPFYTAPLGTTGDFDDLEQIIHHSSGFNADTHYLIYEGKKIEFFEHEKTIEQYGLINESVIFLIEKILASGYSIKLSFKVRDTRTGIIDNQTYNFYSNNKFDELFTQISKNYQLDQNQFKLKAGDEIFQLSSHQGQKLNFNKAMNLVDLIVDIDNPASEQDNLLKIVESQSVKGFWECTQTICSLLTNKLGMQLEKEFGKKPSGSEAQRIWMTKIILKIFAKRFSSEKKKLKFIVRKAKKWLKLQGKK